MKARLLFLSALLLAGCMVGPDYRRPDPLPPGAPLPEGYKEVPPQGQAGEIPWKPAAPRDAQPRGKWWEIYGDSELNALEEKVTLNNQNIAAAEAQYRQARAAVRVANSALYPTVNFGPSLTNSRGSTTIGKGAADNSAPSNTVYNLPVQLTYVVDVWGQVRRQAEEGVANAQNAAALLENARLSYQAELAQDWFSLHGSDSQIALLQDTISSYEKYLVLTENLYKSGVDSAQSVAQAKAQLEQARVTLLDTQLARAQYEHAIAILVGVPPAQFALPAALLAGKPPALPPGVPAALLERRPDIAAQERSVASANAAIGVATAGYYPQINLNGSVGPQSSYAEKLFTWPSLVWSVGPSLLQPLYNAGLNHAQVVQARAAYDASVATYRQTVLTAFQQVEDDLVGLRFLEAEETAEMKAVEAANKSLQIATNAYKAGTQSYLDVIVAQNVALTNQQNAITIRNRRMNTSVLLIQALGGGWDAGQLPSRQEVSTLPKEPAKP
ncbi:MAG: efflux transporter outer membrane subunit [Verrucomicrobium sp.]|nr:efflux transporter outer membrane subunit [Verrucomicrobium sp.]